MQTIRYILVLLIGISFLPRFVIAQEPLEPELIELSDTDAAGNNDIESVELKDEKKLEEVTEDSPEEDAAEEDATNPETEQEENPEEASEPEEVAEDEVTEEVQAEDSEDSQEETPEEEAEKDEPEEQKEEIIETSEVSTEETPEEAPEEKEEIKTVITSAPIVPEPAPQISATESFTNADDDEAEIAGIDTVEIDEPKGNWLFKRIWWEKAERIYEKVKETVTQTFDARMDFFMQRTELDRSVLDPFYVQSGIGQGELLETVSYFIGELQKERTDDGSLGEDEREFLDKLTEEKKTLEQLKLDVDAVLKLDQAVDDALNKLMEQMNRARSYERKAWNAFKAITRELSDQKAREHYYTMRNMLQNCKSVRDYVQKAFTQHFANVTGQVKQKVSAVKQAVEGLKQKGIDLKEEAKKLQEEPEEQAKPVQEEDFDNEDEEEYEVQRPKGILGTIGGFFTSIGNGIMSFFKMIGSGISNFVTKVLTMVGLKKPAPAINADFDDELGEDVEAVEPKEA